MYYNPENDNRLAFTKTVYPDSNLTQLVKLGYQDYLNSKNQIENVVTTVEQRSASTNGDIDEDYTRLNNELQALINNNSGASS